MSSSKGDLPSPAYAARHPPIMPMGSKGSIMAKRREGEGIHWALKHEYTARTESGTRMPYSDARMLRETDKLPPKDKEGNLLKCNIASSYCMSNITFSSVKLPKEKLQQVLSKSDRTVEG